MCLRWQTTLLVGRGGEGGPEYPHESQPNWSLEQRGSAPSGSLLDAPRQIYLQKREMKRGRTECEFRERNSVFICEVEVAKLAAKNALVKSACES
jgi:hypothetical protein